MKVLIAKGAKKREINAPFSIFLFSRKQAEQFMAAIQEKLDDDIEWEDGWITIYIPPLPEGRHTAGFMPEPWDG